MKHARAGGNGRKNRKHDSQIRNETQESTDQDKWDKSGESFARLPGTRFEVEVLARLVGKEKSTVLLGSQASEQDLDALAAKGVLSKARVIHLATVPDQMLYDKERLVVQAGKLVEFVFENNDLMPHNFVITQPGALEEIGTLAESTAKFRPHRLP